MTSAYLTQTSNKIIITTRSWSEAGPTETKYWIRPEDSDYDQAMAWCKSQGLL